MTQEQAYKIFKSVGGIDYCDEYDCRHLELHYEELLAFAHAVLRAQQVALPMTEEQIEVACRFIEPSLDGPIAYDLLIARAIEKHHGIGAKQ